MFRNVAVSALSGVLAAVMFLVLQNHLYARSFGVIRLDQVISNHMREIAQEPLSEADSQRKGEEFAKALDQAIKEVRDSGVMLLVSPAVVTDESDYTALVESRVKEIMGVSK